MSSSALVFVWTALCLQVRAFLKTKVPPSKVSAKEEEPTLWRNGLFVLYSDRSVKLGYLFAG